MARPKKEVTERRKTKESILKSIEEKNCTEKYILDQVDQYMQYFDDLTIINQKLKEGFKADLVKEKRLITKEMRNILNFLGLKPESDSGYSDEEL